MPRAIQVQHTVGGEEAVLLPVPLQIPLPSSLVNSHRSHSGTASRAINTVLATPAVMIPKVTPS